MKSASACFILIGICLVGLANYFSLKSKKLIEQENKRATIEQTILENNGASLEDEIASLAQHNSIPYQYIELSKTELETVIPCMEKFHAGGELSPLCSKPILDLIVNNIGELGVLQAILGSAINYTAISYDYSFLNRLFSEDASFSDRLTLSFLNQYRDPDALQNLFEKYQDTLFEIIPKSVYEKVFEKQVQAYLSAHKEIAGKPDKEAFFEEIYFKANSQNLHGKYSNYTFWKRRALEKNEETVLFILQEIKIHYDGI